MSAPSWRLGHLLSTGSITLETSLNSIIHHFGILVYVQFATLKQNKMLPHLQLGSPRLVYQMSIHRRDSLTSLLEGNNILHAQTLKPDMRI